MQDGHPQTLGLVLEVDKPETDQESTEQGQEDVQELYPGMVDDGCQHRAEGGKMRKEHSKYYLMHTVITIVTEVRHNILVIPNMSRLKLPLLKEDFQVGS